MHLPRYAASASSSIDNSYVLDVAADVAPNSNVVLIAAACSSGAVKVFAAPPSGGLLAAHGGGGPGGAGKNAAAAGASSSSSSFAHTKPATALAWYGGGGGSVGGNGAALLSASKDGTVACWDIRVGGSGGGGKGGPGSFSSSSSPAQRLRAGEPLHSVCFVEESFNCCFTSAAAAAAAISSSNPAPSSPGAPACSTLVAAGGDGKIFLWDARTGKQLSCFEETHEGDVSFLLRSPARPEALSLMSESGPRGDDEGGGGGGGGGGSRAGNDRRGCFLSAGVDGLVAVWDVSLAPPSDSAPDPAASAIIDEDDAFVTALNANTTISRLGLCAPSASSSPSGKSNHLRHRTPQQQILQQQSLSLWATTGVEGALTWDWGAACDESDSSGGLGPSSSFDDARESLGATAREEEGKRGGKKKGGGGGSSDDGRWSCDYVVGCVAVGVGGGGESSSSSSPTTTLLLAAGDHAGRLALFPLAPPASRGGAPSVLGCSPMLVPTTAAASAGGGGAGGAGGHRHQQQKQRPPRGHSATVRAIVSAAPWGRSLATGGEDGLVVLWSASSGGGGGNGNDDQDDGDDDESDSDDDVENGDGGGSKHRRGGGALSSSAALMGVSGGGLAKKKKKRRQKKKKKNSDAVAMVIE